MASSSAQKKKMSSKRSSNKRRTSRQKQKLSFKEATNQIRQSILSQKPKDFTGALKVAITKANKIKKNIKPARIIPIPKQGGVLPLIPIFAGLSALGALSGGAAGIAKAVNDAKAASEQLKEAQRHNKAMEAVALGKGLCLKQRKQGLGLFLASRNVQQNYP
jgi:hypothetical protein